MNPAILITLVGLAVLIGTNYASALDRANAELNVTPILKLKDFDAKGVRFEIQLTAKNPTSASFDVQYPYFKITYRGIEVASTNPIDKKFPVKPHSTSQVNGIFLTAQYSKLVWAGIEIEKALVSGEPITFQVDTLSTIYTAVGQMAFKQTDNLVLQR